MIILSNLSNIPPCPGIIEPKSLISQFLFTDEAKKYLDTNNYVNVNLKPEL